MICSLTPLFIQRHKSCHKTKQLDENKDYTKPMKFIRNIAPPHILALVLTALILATPANSQQSGDIKLAQNGVDNSRETNLSEEKPLTHGIAMHGKLKYPADFTHLEYANPEAPKEGSLKLGVQGTFTSLNPLNTRGGAAAGIRGYLYESLLGRALDEPFSLYGLLAKNISLPDDRSSITFYLNEKARFSDGKPVTRDDVIFSHELLRDNGRPNHRTYYSKVKSVEKVGTNGVKFTFADAADREIPLILGLMPVLPKHAMDAKLFKETSLNPPVGSGPYKIKSLDPGKDITYELNEDYWGRNLPINKGRFNFKEISFIYFRDANTLFEGFKKGLHDVSYENNPGKWSTAYNFNAINDGRVLKKEFELKIPSGMLALVFNTRRPKFKDQHVRRALIHMFNFEDINRKLFHGLYTRTQSYFDRSNLSSTGRKPDQTEADILSTDFAKAYPKIYNGSFRFPKNRATGLDRRNIRTALKLFKAAGYELKSGRMTDKATGTPFSFEILTVSKAQEPLLLSFIENLKLIGVTANIRQVDSTAYQKRQISFDFDMVQNNWSGSLSPGNEQLFRWGAEQANKDGSFNYAGIADKQVDKAIEALLAAKTHEKFVSSVRALDRVLLSGDYVIPLYHLKAQWLAHWAYLRHPKTVSFYGAMLDTWWYDERKK